MENNNEAPPQNKMENNDAEQGINEEQCVEEQSKVTMVLGTIKAAVLKFYHMCKSLGGLIILLVIYNVLGALLFQSIESEKEVEVKQEMNATREFYLVKFYNEAKDLWVNHTTYNATFVIKTRALMIKYEQEVRDLGSVAGPDTVWSFWSALFFCGTIYTTIGKFKYNVYMICNGHLLWYNILIRLSIAQ